MKKMKWSPWQLTGASSDKFHIKLNRLKLEGFSSYKVKKKKNNGEQQHGVVAIEVNWKGPKTGVVFVPFYGRSWRQRNCTACRALSKNGSLIEWEDEFHKVCSFSTKDALELTFSLLYGENAESNSKMEVLGTVSLNLTDKLGSGMKSDIEAKLPIALKVAGIINGQATLSVNVSFAEVRNSQDLVGNVHNSTGSDGDKLIKRVNYFRSFRKTRKSQGPVEPSMSCDSDESNITTTSTASVPCNLEHSSSKPEFRSPMGSDSPVPDPVKKSVLLSWKRRRLSFNPSRLKLEVPLIQNTNRVDDKVEEIDGSLPTGSIEKANSPKDCWEIKKVISRDGQAKLKTPVFFASFDQRSEMAAGESACTALVMVIAHWLHSNQDVMPSKSQFDSLITEGSTEWQKLCNNEAYSNFFPNKHFDLETVLEADLRPLAVWPENSFVGFFNPEKFESLKEAMSFEKIWNEISNDSEVYDPRIYIVSWNDHFFVLKVEANAYYIIDSLGERLFEGCNQAYILKFDDSSVMYREKKIAEDREGSINEEENMQEVICKGKECCREFIIRFLAAIPLGELEEEEQKGLVPTLPLHQRLQIEFHYSYSPPSSSASSAFSTPSPPFSGEDCKKIK
ncbi:uncharacterized protein LOC125422860 [Ziziphus jujuba]|uniref:Uncharacterized protein LOC125422860 n=1 Tax=Ziziphus jujuba TaxID=326968 RepID=A0ABM3ILM2_ZIZJJ|nr:uncharacterized protein LOC125422860 [Ziziphus jujuba]